MNDSGMAIIARSMTTPPATRKMLWARANRPYASADVAGAPGSAHFFEWAMVQWENTKHTPMNAWMSTGIHTMSGVFSAQSFTVPSKPTCMAIMSGMCA